MTALSSNKKQQVYSLPEKMDQLSNLNIGIMNLNTVSSFISTQFLILNLDS